MPILLLRVDFDRYLKWSKLNRKIKACWCDLPKVRDKIIVCNYPIESVCVSPLLPVFHNFFLNSNYLGNDNMYKLKHSLFLNFQKWLLEVTMFLILTFAVGMLYSRSVFLNLFLYVESIGSPKVIILFLLSNLLISIIYHQ
jgi:hypothetical protein